MNTQLHSHVLPVLGVIVLLWSGAAMAADQASVDPLDWPSWRGPEQNGISRETGLVDEWDPEGQNLLWKSAELGGRSTPIVLRGKIYTIVAAEPETPRQGEKVICADAATGEVLWENRFNVYLSDVPLERVGWANCVGDPATGRIYAMGVCGHFLCLDGETGETLWSRSLTEEFGLLTTYGGRTNTPVLFEDLVIINGVMTNWGSTTPDTTYQVFDTNIGGWGDMAKPAHRFLAMNKSTGEAVWLNGTRLAPDDTTYSTPTVTVLGGQAALVFGAGDGSVYAMQPRTGNLVWRYQLSIRGMNISPVVSGQTVFMSQSEENVDGFSMGAVAAINGVGSGNITQSGELWKHQEMMAGKSSPIVVDGRLYSVDDGGGLYIYDVETGEQVGGQTGRPRANLKLGSMMRASLLWADGKIFVCEANGRCFVVRPTENGAEITHRLRLPSGEECHGSPIVSHGRIYVPSTGHMYCIGSEDQQTAATEPPPQPQETAANEDAQPAHVQVVPVDLLMKPGAKQQYTVRLFNARGQLLGEQEASLAADGGAESGASNPPEAAFTVAGDGQIDSQGLYTAGSGNTHRAAMVSARVGELTGFARIRIVPPLPWKFDFNDGQVPITWVGARYRHVVREIDGEQVMVKITTIPKGTRSQSWMGFPDLHDYTIQADVYGNVPSRKAPAAAPDEEKPAEEVFPLPTGVDSTLSKMPDIGLIGQRYTLDMMGAYQQLQIRSWPAEVARRATTNVPFEWKTKVWYTLKLQTAAEDGRAVLRGKVWKRGEAEPEEWFAVLEDEAPNLNGSPGLFGNATNAEIYYDNITVTANN